MWWFFKYPEDTRIDYIKRVVGLPGDVIEYRNKQIFVTPQECDSESPCKKTTVPLTFVNRGEFVQNMAQLERFTEVLGSNSHDILRHPVHENPPFSILYSGRYAHEPMDSSRGFVLRIRR